HVLTKPVTPSTLLEAIGDTLHKGVEITTRSEERAESHSEAMAALKGARVLLVEDNDMNQELALELLANAGVEATLAVNGQDALDKLAANPQYDGVLMDCQMPVMDGYTATREIRKNPRYKDLPILAMTANAMAGDREKVLDAGMNDHIAKPLNVNAMFTTMARWIRPGVAQRAKPIAPDSGATHAANTGDGTQFDLKTALAQLETLLRDSDAEAADLLDTIRVHSIGTPLDAILQQVAIAVDSFDFDAALEALLDARL
ncbi:MAG: response regulator, partial [Rhodoferax sp.]